MLNQRINIGRKRGLVRFAAVLFVLVYFVLPFGKPILEVAHSISHAFSVVQFSGNSDHHHTEGHHHHGEDHSAVSGNEINDLIAEAPEAGHEHSIINFLNSMLDGSETPGEDKSDYTITVKTDKHLNPSEEVAQQIYLKLSTGNYSSEEPVVSRQSRVLTPPPRA